MTEPVKNIVWLQTAFLGDCILTTAAIDLARRHLSGVRQFVLTHEVGRAVFSECQAVDGIFVVRKRKESVLTTMMRLRHFLIAKGLSASSQTVLLQVHKSFRSSLIATFSGLRVVCYDESSRLLNFFSTRVKRVGVLHEAVRISLLLEPLGVSRECFDNIRPFVHQRFLSKRTLSREKSHIGFAIGSVWATKAWPASSYARLALQLLQHSGVRITLFGAASDLKEEQDFWNVFDQQANEKAAKMRLRCSSHIGKTSIRQMFAQIAELDLLVANDSAPIHFAAAVDTPTVAIFGATVPEMGFGPLSTESVICSVNDLSCRPCGLHGHKRCPLKHFECMKNITVPDVYIKIKNALELPPLHQEGL